MKTLSLLLTALRPDQWIKNAFVLIPLVFAKQLFRFQSVLMGLTAVGAFCLLAGATYLINDIVDLEADRVHPSKKHRPLASGRISIRTVKWIAILLLGLSLLLGNCLGRSFLFVLAIYLAIQFLYNLKFKELPILDIFCVSAGFFLRVIGGGIAVNVMISNWLIICTISIAMFLTLGKRRSELAVLGAEKARLHRKVFEYYSPHLLDQMISVVTAVTLLSYMLYCISPQTIDKFQTENLIYTFPFVLYGIFRYLYLIHKSHQGESPSRVLTSDWQLLVSVVLWGICCVLIIYGLI
ncbi:MAG: decaprenyl-phosphate phosphoribosyltransferase [Deltaproteobacteria bacterium]|nr:decaprenyl-phosphate phosphoribosyltransferase [Deltaproteobacteria bacterium]